jgi:hypothetical protein
MKCLQIRDRARRGLTAHLRKDIEVPDVVGRGQQALVEDALWCDQRDGVDGLQLICDRLRRWWVWVVLGFAVKRI